jgi:hypothetical protein
LNFGVNDTKVDEPSELVAKIVNKGTKTLSKINQIFKSDNEEIKPAGRKN